MRLFCFPYAGGAAQIFHTWPEGLAPTVEICAVQLPGHGSRLHEAPFTQLPLLVQAVAEVILPQMDRPFAFFGHSMGAIIGFELARLLRAKDCPQPLHLFVSGRRAPQLPEIEPPSYMLSDADFLAQLSKLNGTPSQILKDPELMQLMLPTVRADFELVETYKYKPEPAFCFPITAFGGLQDRYSSRADLEMWCEHTHSEFSLHMFPGDHFFIKSSQALLIQALSMKLDCVIGNNHS